MTSTRPGSVHVLAATDLSDQSLVAVKTAAALAEKLEARLTLIHCFDPVPYIPPMGIPHAQRLAESIEEEMTEAIGKKLQEVRERHLGGVREVRIASVKGPSAAGTVCEYAEEHDVDWIVVGTHGRTGLRHMLVGSVAEKIVRHAPCSVVVARTRASDKTNDER